VAFLGGCHQKLKHPPPFQFLYDQVTRFLSQQDFTSKELGKVIKQTVREIETGEGVLIFDDTDQVIGV
jgi:hypothetical protein